MPYTNENAENKVQIYYEDYGAGQPVILIHGWPLSNEMWEYQVPAIVSAGYRCITYDRRGFGKSCKPYDSYDYSIMADDLHQLISELGITNVILVGFSMGGGEVARYAAKYGTANIAKAVLISSIVPYLLKTGNHPEGVDSEVFDDMIKNLQNDRPGFLKEFGKMFFGVGLLNSPVSDGMLQWTHSLAMPASPKATIDCVRTFSETDLRQDAAALTMPVLIIHGDHDKVVPAEATSNLAEELIPNSEYVIYQGAPHGLFITHKEKLNDDLIAFFRK